jgi:hypothetical protein
MTSPYFFKTSPDNEEFAPALNLHLNKTPENGKGFLVRENRKDDI